MLKYKNKIARECVACAYSKLINDKNVCNLPNSSPSKLDFLHRDIRSNSGLPRNCSSFKANKTHLCGG